ncbi:MAG: CBS domain-containing protein, partial [Candidatus Dadabacteria bacterium]
TTIDQAVDGFFLRYGFGGFPVLDGGRLLGLITLKEVKDVPRQDWGRVRTGDVMIPLSGELEIPPEAPAMAALEKMVTGDKGRLVVVGNGGFLGLVTRNGIAKYVQIRGR